MPIRQLLDSSLNVNAFEWERETKHNRWEPGLDGLVVGLVCATCIMDLAHDIHRNGLCSISSTSSSRWSLGCSQRTCLRLSWHARVVHMFRLTSRCCPMTCIGPDHDHLFDACSVWAQLSRGVNGGEPPSLYQKRQYLHAVSSRCDAPRITWHP